MPIIKINDPQWNKNDRNWVIEYTIKDANMGIYTQIVKAQTLLSAENYIKLLKEKQK